VSILSGWQELYAEQVRKTAALKQQLIEIEQRLLAERSAQFRAQLDALKNRPRSGESAEEFLARWTAAFPRGVSGQNPLAYGKVSPDEDLRRLGDDIYSRNQHGSPQQNFNYRANQPKQNFQFPK